MRILGVAVALLVLLPLACVAADSPKVALDAKDMPLDQAFAELGKQANVQIVCDTGATGTVTGHFESIELEKLLNSITKSNDLAWQKLYIKSDADQKPTLAQIKANADAVAAVSGGTIVVCDPVTGKQKVFVEQESAKPAVEPDKLGLTMVYLVSKPKAVKTDTAASTDTPAKRMQALEAERMKLMADMTPDQRVAAMQQEMVSMMALDPTTRAQMMVDRMNAMRTMDPQTRQAYEQAQHDTFRQLRDSGQIPDHGGRGNHGMGAQSTDGNSGKNQNKHNHAD